MLLPNDGKSVVVGNPAGADFETCRRSLLPGLLKSLAHNKKMPLPLKLFEIGDCVELSDETDVGAKNVRKLAVIYTNRNSGFEVPSLLFIPSHVQ